MINESVSVGPDVCRSGYSLMLAFDAALPYMDLDRSCRYQNRVNGSIIILKDLIESSVTLHYCEDAIYS